MPGISVPRIAIPFKGKGGINYAAYWATLISATVEDAEPTKVVLVYPTGRTLLATDYSIAGKTISGITISEDLKTHTLTVTAAFVYGDAPTVSLKGLTAKMVTNNVTSAMFTDGDEFDNGKLVLQFDDGDASNYTNAFPLFKSKGIAFTVFIPGGYVGMEGNLTWAQIREMQEDGMDMQCHGFTETNFDELTEEQLIAQMVNNDAVFVANGVEPPLHHAYNAGKLNDLSLEVVGRYRKTQRTTDGYDAPITRKSIKSELSCNSMESAELAIELMDYAKEKKIAIILIGHKTGLDGPNNISMEDLEDIIDYAQSIGLDIITTNDLYDLMFYLNLRLSRSCPDDQIDIYIDSKCKKGESIILERSIDGENYTVITTLTGGELKYSDTGLSAETNYFYRARALDGDTYHPYSRVEAIATPSTMTFTPTGTGAEVSSIELITTRDLTISSSGSARFYTNADGTEGESDTVIFPRQFLKKIYLRCPTGVSDVIFPHNTLTYFSWVSGTNAGSVAFDLSNFNNGLRNYINGNNTVYNTVALRGRIRDLSVSDSNILSDTIEHLQLNVCKVLGNTTISGEYNGGANTKILAIGGNATINIDLSTLINVTECTLRGNCVITGNTENLTKATYVYIVGANNSVAYVSYVWPAGMKYFYIGVSAGNGWSVAGVSQAIIDAAATTWTAGKTLILASPHASMANTTQGGIWGNFDGETSPSVLAVAYKTLIRTRGVTASIRGVTAPGATGDGTGFPAGFGDWYRS